MSDKKFNISSLIQKQKLKETIVSKPINLEALVNSGKIRVEKGELKNIPDSAKKRK
ncbi:hypothetical protein [Flavicella sediminum]|uniref:hypothetical protein n=1 Tax=Flavicella sediminum TaxID=2585141 RepID=UPI001407600D|nr:hypothetical protein [Flavicella sediminum]